MRTAAMDDYFFNEIKSHPTELISHQCISVLFDGLRPSVKA